MCTEEPGPKHAHGSRRPLPYKDSFDTGLCGILVWLQVTSELVSAVVSLLEDDQPQVRVLACRAVAGCAAEPLASRVLVSRLDDVSTEVRVAAARALEAVAVGGLDEVLGALALHSADASPAVRNACSGGLVVCTLDMQLMP